MNTIQSHSNRPVGIHKLPGPAGECDDALAAILCDVLRTREVRQILITVVPELLDVWANKSSWKRAVSKLAGSTVKKQLSKPEDVFEKNELKLIFEDKKFIENLGEILPDFINQLVDALTISCQSLEKFSVEDKTELFETLLSHTGKGRTGALLTNCARILNDIHNADPEFFTNTLEPGFKQWLESTDFGELKEAMDNSEKDIFALTEAINDTIWQYPSKVIGIFSLVPSLVNMITGSLNISIEKLNALPPDLLTDIVISLMNEINGKGAARFADEITEIARKLHVGSALLGEPGSPQLSGALSAKLDEIISQIDPAIFWKGRIALARIKAVYDDALSDAVSDKPEFARLNMINGPELLNIRLRSVNKKLSLLETMDDPELEKLLPETLSAYDVQEAAEVFNNIIRLANLLWEKKPKHCADSANQFLNAIDFDELAFMTEQVFENMGEDIRPIARTFVPGLVEWVCDVLQPEHDENEDNAARARKALSSLLMAEEV